MGSIPAHYCRSPPDPILSLTRPVARSLSMSSFVCLLEGLQFVVMYLYTEMNFV